ncbi:unnamed protein product [Rhizophagus irregularis]|nr:unnamed protein product [Rhizophagus irregularis]
MSPFTPQINNTIEELLKVLEHLPNFCEKICEKVNKQYATNFTLNQVRQHLKDELQVKIPQNRGEPFTEQIDNSIKEFIKKLGQSSNPYVKVSENINKLLQYEIYFKTNSSTLDNKDEKSFIVQWAESKRGDTIPWKELIPLMEKKFEKLRSENMNSRKRKGSPKLKEKNEKQQKNENEKYIKFSPPNGDSNARPMDTSPKSEENIIHLPLLNARPMEISFNNEEKIHLPPLNARPIETSFKSEERIHLSPLNAGPIEILFENKERSHLPPLNASPMEISFERKERIHLPPLNASLMEISFNNEEKIHLPPLNARPIETSFKSEERIHLSPLNAGPIEILFENKERSHLPPLNASPMEISFENEENTPPLNRMDILCLAADEAYKRDYPQISTK